MGISLTRSGMEERRFEAIKLLKQGYSQVEIARKFDVTPAAVNIWKKKHEADGKKALRAIPHSGRPNKLDENQREELTEFLDQGALACGFETDDWTCQRVQQLICEQFDVDYHVDHLSRLLRELGYSAQRPKQRSKKHDAQAVKTWRRKNWKRIKKGR